MLENFPRYFGSPLARRIAAIVALLLTPPFIVVAFIVGTLGHVYVSTKDYLKDLKAFVTHEIPSLLKDLFMVLRTGKQI